MLGFGELQPWVQRYLGFSKIDNTGIMQRSAYDWERAVLSGRRVRTLYTGWSNMGKHGQYTHWSLSL